MDGGWRRLMDTYLESPHDFCEPVDAPGVQDGVYVLQPRSMVLLMADYKIDNGTNENTTPDA